MILSIFPDHVIDFVKNISYEQFKLLLVDNCFEELGFSKEEIDSVARKLFKKEEDRLSVINIVESQNDITDKISIKIPGEYRRVKVATYCKKKKRVDIVKAFIVPNLSFSGNNLRAEMMKKLLEKRFFPWIKNFSFKYYYNSIPKNIRHIMFVVVDYETNCNDLKFLFAPIDLVLKKDTCGIIDFHIRYFNDFFKNNHELFEKAIKITRSEIAISFLSSIENQ